MKMLPYLWLSIMLGVPTAVDSARGQDPSAEPPASPERSEIPAMFKIGDVGERVREIQRTLNEKLAGGFIELPPHSQVGPRVGQARNPDKDALPNEQVRRLVLDNGRIDLRIRGNWQPCDEKGDPIPEGELEKEGVPERYLQLPEPERGRIPILVDGVFGQHTKSGVIMFQLENNLQPTGEVDAVTLDKLEPMIPTSWLLGQVMRWVKNLHYYETRETREDYPLRIKQTTSIITTALILLVAGILHLAARKLSKAPGWLAGWLFVPRTSAWFKAMGEKRVFVRVAQFVPALFICLAAKLIFPEPENTTADPFPYLDVFQKYHVFLWRFGMAYTALVGMLVALAYANACDLFFACGEGEDNPIWRITRAVKRMVVLVGVLLFWSALTWKNPMYFVGGLGAIMAVLMLVFRGTILGLVASVQIVANRMVRVGDWIEVPTHGSNGRVEEISLTTVKIRNFDKSISMIPMAGLLSESFHNWSDMQRAGGRRIKRAIYIDIESILVCTPEMIGQFEKIELIRGYLLEKRRDIEEYNKERDVEASPVNSRRLTNIGTFRAYIEAYLANHPRLRADFMHLVRQLQPGEHGLPIEISIFCRDTDWPTFESVQADIFDHLLSLLPEFQLRAFQALKSH